MSDTFDHEFDAYEAALEDGYLPTFTGNKRHQKWKGPHWECKTCGRRHPPHHKACFWCKPTTVTTGFK